MENPLELTCREGFERVFIPIEISNTLDLKNPNQLKVYCLDTDSSKISYESLIRFIQKNIDKYVFSRVKIDKYIQNNESNLLAYDASTYLREIKDNDDSGKGGELGEILLYIFLESVCNAPKLLSKYELKTSNNHYVHGADAVHLLYMENDGRPRYQLIIGEAKTISELKIAIDKAFISIGSCDKRKEIELIESAVLGCQFNDEATEVIKKLFIPNERDLTLSYDTAYGIFIGYSINIADDIPNSEFQSKVIQQVKSDVENIVPHIMKKIEQYGLSSHSFYIYILPFNNVTNDRADIMRKIRRSEP